MEADRKHSPAGWSQCGAAPELRCGLGGVGAGALVATSLSQAGVGGQMRTGTYSVLNKDRGASLGFLVCFSCFFSSLMHSVLKMLRAWRGSAV